MRTLALAIAILVSGCGGQVSAKPLNVCLQPSDRVVAMTGCDAVIHLGAIAAPYPPRWPRHI